MNRASNRCPLALRSTIAIKLITIPSMLLVLGSLGHRLPLWLGFLIVPRVNNSIIIKDAPNGWRGRGSAVLLAARPASWVAAWLGPSGGLRWSPAWLLWGSTLGLRWSTAGLLLGASGGLCWSPILLFLLLLVVWLLMGSSLGCRLLGRWLGCSRLRSSHDWAGLTAQLGELLFSEGGPGSCRGRQLDVHGSVSC
jgi:hypothetical protein